MFELSVHKRLVLLSVSVLVGSLVFSSASFAAVPTFNFSGSGLGHGVGMSQEGAMGMAKAGKSVATIMSTYYTGTTLTTESLSNSVLVDLDSSKSAHSSWTIRPGYDGSYFTISGRTTKFPDDKYTFSVSGGRIIMTSASGKTAAMFTSPSSITIVPAPVSGADLDQVVDASGPFKYANVRYRGNLTLKISGSKLSLINKLTMQDYLYGVVPREMPFRYAASSQAQAIAARSYAYQSVVNGKILYCNTYSQMYNGHSRFTSEVNRENGDATLHESASSNAAVVATKDQCVTYKGSVVRAYFAACNGDYTANITDVWGSNSLTYWSTAKTSVRDYYCENMHPGTNSGHHNWTKSYTGYTLANQLKAKGISCPSGAGTTVYVTKFTPTYGTNGWVKKVVVTWSTGQTTTVATCADNVRIKLGFSSAQFTVTSSTPLSTDCYAKNISVTGGTLDVPFTKTDLTYHVASPTSTTNVAIRVAKSNPYAKTYMRISGRSYHAHTGYNVKLAPGHYTYLYIKVKAQDSSHSRTYVIKVTRRSLSADPYAKHISVTPGDLDVPFSKTDLSYHVTTLATTDSVAIRVAKSNSSATTYMRISGRSYHAHTGYNVKLAPGHYTYLYIRVVAQDMHHARTYVIKVTRSYKKI